MNPIFEILIVIFMFSVVASAYALLGALIWSFFTTKKKEIPTRGFIVIPTEGAIVIRSSSTVSAQPRTAVERESLRILLTQH